MKRCARSRVICYYCHCAYSVYVKWRNVGWCSWLPFVTVGWGGFQLGFSKNDPEPGRCRRTDGKKWRCSRDAVADQKYCERHVNRGRHRSRKHVEAGTTTTTTPPAPSSVNRWFFYLYECNYKTFLSYLTLLASSRAIKEKESAVAAPPKLNQHNAHTSSEFGSVCSDSLLNPLSSSHALRHFIDEWPKSHPETRPRSAKDKCETDEATKMGLGIGPAVHSVASEQSQRHNYWIPTSWEPSAGGPLGEALHATSNGEGKCKNKRAHDFMETRLHSSSPVGARRGGPGAESGDGTSFCNGIISSGFMLPSLPALWVFRVFVIHSIPDFVKDKGMEMLSRIKSVLFSLSFVWF